MRVAIIGTGPSGIAAASILAERQIPADLFDGGESPEPSAQKLAHDIATGLKQGQCPDRSQMNTLRFGSERHGLGHLLSEAAATVLHKSIESRQLAKKIFGSDFTFRGTEQGIPLSGAWMPRSLAPGGLSNVWGAACYPLRQDDYDDWPFAESDLSPWYGRAQQLAGVSGEADGLVTSYPIYAPLAPAGGDCAFDPGSPLEATLRQWQDKQAALRQQGIAGGRPRLAVNPPGHSDKACLRCGLCLFGCPVDAIWHADKTLSASPGLPGTNHLPGVFVRRLRRNSDGMWLVTGKPGASEQTRGPYAAVILAAGALSSLRIAVDSLELAHHRCSIVENDTFVIPFRMRSAAGTAATPVSFALSQAALALDPGTAGKRAAHLQLYRITEPLLGAIGKTMVMLPGQLGTAILNRLHRYLIGLFYLHSDDSRHIQAEVTTGSDGISQITVTVSESETGAQPERAMSVLKAARDLTGLTPITPLVRHGPAGFSGHIGGTLPMKAHPALLQTHRNGLIEGLPAVYAMDMAVFPTMPAQNPTLTSMANAMRCAAMLADDLLGSASP